MPGTTETAIERRNPSIAVVDEAELTIEFCDKGTYREALRIINERGIELYGKENR